MGFEQALKVIPRKLKLLMFLFQFFFEIFPEFSLPGTVSINTMKMIGNHARLRDVAGQSYTILARTVTNHARYSSVQVIFCDSWMHT